MKILVGLVLLAGGLARAGVLDNFNRTDASTLGSGWTNQAGGQEIINNMARSLDGAQNSSLATFNGVSAGNAFVDVHDVSGDLSYLAIVLGYLDLNNSYFIKVQGTGQFNNAAFYYGNNGSGLFFALDTPFADGRITAFMTGTSATLQIDTNFDGTAEQTYTHDYGTASGGTGIGLGFYGTAQADNFGSNVGDATPEPGTGAILLMGAGVIAAGLRRRKAL